MSRPLNFSRSSNVPKTYRVLLTRHAQNDLEEIYTYIAADSPGNAAAFVFALEKQILSLATMPERSPLIPENSFFGTRLRHLVYKKYRVVFRVQNETVFVLRVIHGSQLLGM